MMTMNRRTQAWSYKREEAEAQEIYAENEKHLKNFGKHLESKGLSAKTIKNHLQNVSFYINDFLCYYDIQHVKAGCFNIDPFLGGWFIRKAIIRKAMWANCTWIKGMAASIKKFYAFLLEQKVIEKTTTMHCVRTSRKTWMSGWKI